MIIIAVLIAAGYFGVQHLKQKKIVAKPKAILEEELPTIASKDSKFYDAYKKSDKLNVLILGVNSNLTDTIMLMSYDRKKDHIGSPALLPVLPGRGQTGRHGGARPAGAALGGRGDARLRWGLRRR